MAALFTALLFCVITVSFGNPTSRIIDGKEVKVNEIPYQISIRTPIYEHFCSGSIITEFFVLTAAHCVEPYGAEDMTIISGTVDLDRPGTEHKVIDVIIHEKYNADDSWVNDIALIRSATPLEVNKFGILPEPFVNPKPGVTAVVSGWGVTEEGAMSRKLLKTEIYITEQEKCKAAYEKHGKTVYPTQVCANNPEKTTGACNADSGGPLVVNDRLVGIVSWSNECASQEYPTVFTRVSHYMDWILEHVPLVRPAL